MQEETSGILTRPWERVLATVLGSIFIILAAFTTEAVLALKRDVDSLQNVLVTKQELANLAACLGPADPVLAGLEGSCTSCHTADTFAEAHGYTMDAHVLVTRMSDLWGANIDPDDVPKVEAALTFMKCGHCHTIDRLKQLAILSPQDRWQTIARMRDEPGATITQEDAQRIRERYTEFWTWQNP
jgi:hypothetical protein